MSGKNPFKTASPRLYTFIMELVLAEANVFDSGVVGVSKMR